MWDSLSHLDDLLTIAFIWPENMLGYLSANIICSEKRTVFRERSLFPILSIGFKNWGISSDILQF